MLNAGDLKQYLVVTLLVTGVSVSIMVAREFIPLFRVAENWVADLRMATLTPNAPQSRQVIVVAVNEDTLAELHYRSPVDRNFLSRLLLTLQAKGARAIGVDLLFDQPTEPGKDEELRTTLNHLNIPVVVAWADADDNLTRRQVSFMKEYLAGVPRGLARILKDPHDGTVRDLFIGNARAGDGGLSLAASLVKSVGGSLPGDAQLPLGYRGWPESGASPFATFPAHSVDLLPDEWIKDRIVLIGADLLLQDRHRTPLSVGVQRKGQMAGVNIHAHSVSQLLEGSRLRYLSRVEDLVIYSLFAVAGIILAYLPWPVVARSLFGLGIVVMLWSAGALLYHRSGIMVPLVMPTLTLMITTGAVTGWMWRREQARRRFIRLAFNRYLSPAVIDKIVANPGQLRLGGEQRELTFLFTDIAEFTGLTERTDPEVLVKLLNDYLEGVCDVAMEHGGTIDKVVGDALCVIFNAPLDQPDHPRRAVTCALALDRFCQEFRAARFNEGIELGVTRIGVNTGSAIVGNFGGENRFDYTAHGDAVNVAARLESVNKHLGTRISVSQSTVERVEHMRFRQAGDLILQGKTETISVYEPYNAYSHSEIQFEEYKTAFESLKDMHANAIVLFGNLAQKYPDDGLLLFHLSRLDRGETGHRITMTKK